MILHLLLKADNLLNYELGASDGIKLKWSRSLQDLLVLSLRKDLKAWYLRSLSLHKLGMLSSPLGELFQSFHIINLAPCLSLRSYFWSFVYFTNCWHSSWRRVKHIPIFNRSLSTFLFDFRFGVLDRAVFFLLGFRLRTVAPASDFRMYFKCLFVGHYPS